MSAIKLSEEDTFCPACEGVRDLTLLGLCDTCTREWKAGRLTEYRNRLASSEPYPTSKGMKSMFEPLFKRTADQAVQTWQIRVEPQDDGTAIIITTHGQIGGAMQEARDHVRAGKNPGKKNATTPIQQAIKEAESKWTRQRDRNHYGLTVEESENKKLVAPMLAQKFTETNGELTTHAARVNWADSLQNYVQPKFDGHRCLAIRGEQGVQLFTRKGDQVVTCGHLIEQLMQVMPPNTTFDGELYIHGVAVTTIGGYIKREQEGTKQLCFVMYDMVSPEPFVERIARLCHIVQVSGRESLHLARTQSVTGMDDVMRFQEECIANGYEGAMLRHGTTGYEPGARSSSLLKVKTFVDGEVTIVGCKQGRGNYEGAAVFECLTDDNNPVDVTAPGDMPTKRQFWTDRERYVGKRLTIKYQKLTETANPVPFQPVAKGILD